MSGIDESCETTAWCAECKRLFETFAEADGLWQSLTSEVESAVAARDSPEIERLKISAVAARQASQHAKEAFITHRSRHDRSVLAYV